MDLQAHDKGTEVLQLREQLRLQEHELQLAVKRMESTEEEHRSQLSAWEATVRELESRMARA